jgi:hypothetical protein
MLGFSHIVHRLIGIDRLRIKLSIFIVVQVSLMLVVEVERISILKFLVLFSGLSLTSIALLAEGKVDVVAVETQPVTLPGLVV